MSIAAVSDRPMLEDICRQPVELARILDRGQAFRELGRVVLKPDAGGRLYGFGCGDGWFAANAVAGVTAQALGRPMQAVTSLAMDARAQSGHVTARDRAVAISMSGSVDRTNAAAEALSALGGRVVALTNEGGGALGQIAAARASLQVDDVAPFLTGTTRYSATVLGLMLLLDGAAGEGGRDGLMGALRNYVLRDLPEMIAVCRRSLPAICTEICAQPVGGVRVLGAGAGWATADFGAAKLVKLLDVPVWAGEIEEYAHSQFWSARKDEVVILLASDAHTAAVARNTAEALAVAGMRTLAIETGGVAVDAATWRLSMPAFPDWMTPLSCALPLQLLAYEFAVAAGRDPNVSQDKADPARFEAAQLLSRRCELPA